MASVGSPTSDGRSSSSTDFYNTETPQDSMGNEPVPTPNVAPDDSYSGYAGEDDGDSSSEMDVGSSRSPSPVSEPHTGMKRKLSDSPNVTSSANFPNFPPRPDDGFAKKQRATRDQLASEYLPIELWQLIFMQLPPAALGRCLSVCKAFMHHLTQAKALPAVPKSQQSKPCIVDSDFIWIQARKIYFPAMPRPLPRYSDMEMFQLIFGKACQFCKRIPVSTQPGTSPFNSGPGPDGLRVIWTFGIRTCGQCFEANTLKDVEILTSPAAPLRFGLPYGFRTQDNHFVPDMTRQLQGSIPAHLRVAKVYYKHDIEDILREFEDAKSFGEGAADEWRKGLTTKGKDAMSDASRWERWESQLHLTGDLSSTLREYDHDSFPHSSEAFMRRSTGAQTHVQQSPSVANGMHALPQPVYAFQPPHNPQYQAPAPQYQVGQPPAQNPQYHQAAPRPARDPQEVERARQARRAEIERRCMELLPPLEPKVLQYIESFQAALQITQPLNDAQWEMLRPRLLAQREAAELVEHQRAEQWAALQAAIPQSQPHEMYMRPAKEVYDQAFEDTQQPLRNKLSEYADDVINGQWHRGQGLDQYSSPLFAIQTILHVERRYHEDKEAGFLDLDTPPQTQGSKEGTPIPAPFLSLDNMKWLHDNKIRPLTDRHAREIFICAGCIEEGKPHKWFAFEGLIQHYGAKHTTDFSRGNIVVHWQTADWPEETPFVTDPTPFIKKERKHEMKDIRRTARKSAAQNGGDTTYDTPAAPGLLLSENPLFSSKPHPPAHERYEDNQHTSLPHHPMDHSQYAPVPQGGYQYPPPAPMPPQPTIDVSYDTQLSKLSTDARAIWDELDGVKDLIECVRIQTVIHHVASRFEDRFHQKPDLDLLTDALATNDSMRPLKLASGLACKSCVAAQTSGSAYAQPYYARISDVKLYTTFSLITHFKIVHHSLDYLDWTTDLLEVPEPPMLRELLAAPGMNDRKLGLVASAFSGVFTLPLPIIGQVSENAQPSGPESGILSRLYGRSSKGGKQGKKKNASSGNGSGGVTPSGRSGYDDGSLPDVGDDEYDPTKPLFTHSNTRKESSEFDPARFDTDFSRKRSSAGRENARTPSGSTFGLAPETLAALNTLTSASRSTQPAYESYEYRKRSPSVGRANAPTSTTGPDISAILASLGAQQPTPGSSNPLRASYPPPAPAPADPYSRSRGASPYHPASRRTSDRYPSGSYRNSGAGALSSPARYETHDTSPYHPQQHHQPPILRSPPQHRYESAYPHPPPPQTIFQDRAPVQYVTLPDTRGGAGRYDTHQHPPPHPQQPPVYYDEYGRAMQLIPIDDGGGPPPTMQMPYARPPVAYEQQQVYYQPAPPQALPREGGGYYAPQPVQVQQVQQVQGDGRHVHGDGRQRDDGRPRLQAPFGDPRGGYYER